MFTPWKFVKSFEIFQLKIFWAVRSRRQYFLFLIIFFLFDANRGYRFINLSKCTIKWLLLKFFWGKIVIQISRSASCSGIRSKKIRCKVCWKISRVAFIHFWWFLYVWFESTFFVIFIYLNFGKLFLNYFKLFGFLLLKLNRSLI